MKVAIGGGAVGHFVFMWQGVSAGGQAAVRGVRPGGITVNSSHVVVKWDIMFAMGLL